MHSVYLFRHLDWKQPEKYSLETKEKIVIICKYNTHLCENLQTTKEIMEFSKITGKYIKFIICL